MRKRFQVAGALSDRLGQASVLFDKYCEAEFARPDLDTYLQKLYHEQSELIVVFLCAEYEGKRWCKLEWRAIRDLIGRIDLPPILLVRFDRTEIPGLYSGDGDIEVNGRPGAAIADLILQRLQSITDKGAADPPSTAQTAAGWPTAKIHNLPYGPLGSLFKGRDEQLLQLHERLTAESAHAAAIVAQQAIHGLGGVGKTRLAVEYAWRYGGEYAAVLFISADGRSNLHRALADLCRVLNLPEQMATEEAVQVEAVLRHLAAQPGWLLVLDNTDSDDGADEVLHLLPRLTGGAVLITSRCSQWPGEVARLALDVLAEADAVAFLLERTADDRHPDPDDEQVAAELADQLGCLALALEQAAAYVNRRRQARKGPQSEDLQVRQPSPSEANAS